MKCKIQGPIFQVLSGLTTVISYWNWNCRISVTCNLLLCNPVNDLTWAPPRREEAIHTKWERSSLSFYPMSILNQFAEQSGRTFYRKQYFWVTLFNFSHFSWLPVASGVLRGWSATWSLHDSLLHKIPVWSQQGWTPAMLGVECMWDLRVNAVFFLLLGRF